MVPCSCTAGCMTCGKGIFAGPTYGISPAAEVMKSPGFLALAEEIKPWIRSAPRPNRHERRRAAALRSHA